MSQILSAQILSAKTFTHRLVKRSQLAGEKGFSLVEVITAILLLATFTMIGASLMVYAAVMRAGAREESSLTDRLHQNLEQIRAVAADRSQVAANAAACVATVNTAGYATLLQNRVASTPALNLPATFQVPGSQETVAMTRTFTVRDVPPYNILQIKYDVQAPGKGSVTALQTEVIPDAALSCN